MAKLVPAEGDRTETNVSKHGEESQWSELLPELVNLVSLAALRVDPGVIPNIPRVCKSWNLLDINIVRHPLHHSISNLYQFPYLISMKGRVCEILGHNYTFNVEFSKLVGSYIRFAKFGWLLLSCGREDTFFFNPFTKERIDLPKNRYPFLSNGFSSQPFFSIGFSSPPTTSYWCVIGMTLLDFQIIQCGEIEWSSIEFPEEIEVQCPYSHPAFYENYCYFLGDKGKIIAIDIKKKTSYSFVVYSYSYSRSFLVENAGNLLAIFVSDQEEDYIYIKEIRISNIKENSDLSTIVKGVKSLKNNMLFLSRTSCFLKPAILPWMSNKVYFPKVRNDDFIYYSLDSKTYGSISGDFSSKMPSGAEVEELTDCAWIEPI